MGLCKCSRRRVTNLFCFEHNVSVCEHCIVADHPACVIKSYLHWLDDSDYDPTCPFPWCRRILKDAECARLVCYHVFHWNCLNKHFTQDLPANTAPAGYQCPLCKRCVFPEPNNASPVSDALRKKLETVEWGRAGLSAGAMEAHHATSSNNSHTDELPADRQHHHGVMPEQHFGFPTHTNVADNAFYKNDSGLPHLSGQPVNLSVENLSSSYRKNEANGDTQLLLPAPSKDPNVSSKSSSKNRHHTEPFVQSSDDAVITRSDYDADNEKYNRRSFSNQFSRLFKNRFVLNRHRNSRSGGGPILKYICFVLVIGLIVFFTGSLLFTGVMRRGDGGGGSAAELVELPGGHHRIVAAGDDYPHHAVRHQVDRGRQTFAQEGEFDGNDNNIQE